MTFDTVKQVNRYLLNGCFCQPSVSILYPVRINFLTGILCKECCPGMFKVGTRITPASC